MNKSIEHIKSSIESGETAKKFPNTGWDNAEILNPLTLLEKFFEATPNKAGEIVSIIDQRTCKLSYNPDADFDYFTSNRVIHDGTSAFSIETIRDVLAKVLTGCTYCRNKAPEGYSDFSIPGEISLVMGDVLILTERGMHEINGHEMMSEKQTVAIPIKWDCELRGKE